MWYIRENVGIDVPTSFSVLRAGFRPPICEPNTYIIEFFNPINQKFQGI